nr:molybdopterin-binding protein [Synergistaceae bacterium]
MARIEYVNIEDALGMALSHDMTQIDVKSGYKGARFKRGHIVKPEDLPVLRSMGKNSISVLYLEEGDVHEDDAALRLAHRLAGEGLRMEGPEEGKVSLFAEWNGLIVYDEESIHTINRMSTGLPLQRRTRFPSK